jgi:hypothetical protein
LKYVIPAAGRNLEYQTIGTSHASRIEQGLYYQDWKMPKLQNMEETIIKNILEYEGKNFEAIVAPLIKEKRKYKYFTVQWTLRYAGK